MSKFTPDMNNDVASVLKDVRKMAKDRKEEMGSELDLSGKTPKLTVFLFNPVASSFCDKLHSGHAPERKIELSLDKKTTFALKNTLEEWLNNVAPTEESGHPHTPAHRNTRCRTFITMH